MKAKPLATIISAGMSKFGRRPRLSWKDLFTEAFIETLQGAPRLDPKQIDAAMVGTMCEGFEHQGHYGASAITATGLISKPGIRLEAACASSGVALRFGIASIMAGLHDIVLVGGAEKMTSKTTREATGLIAEAADSQMDQRNGLTFPAFFGLVQVLHMKKFGSTIEDYAAISVKNHKNGCSNPKAQFQRQVTASEVLNSKIVAWPIRLFDCAPISDGASCLIIAKPEIARSLSDNCIDVIGQGLACDSIYTADKDFSSVTLAANKMAARQAFDMADLKPGDVDLAEVHDCFSCSELIAYEDLGFCEKGKGHLMVRRGDTDKEGTIPINVSGGLKAKGHPVGATGSAQLYEIFLQLNGLAGPRQVSDASIGLCHNLGGCGATAVVTICRKA